MRCIEFLCKKKKKYHGKGTTRNRSILATSSDCAQRKFRAITIPARTIVIVTNDIPIIQYLSTRCESAHETNIRLEIKVSPLFDASVARRVNRKQYAISETRPDWIYMDDNNLRTSRDSRIQRDPRSFVTERSAEFANSFFGFGFHSSPRAVW